MRFMKNILKRNTGQSLVEWAVILPFLLLVLFSIIELAPMMNSFTKLEKAAQYGARTGAIHGSTNDKILENITYNLQGMADFHDLKPAGSSADGKGVLYNKIVGGNERIVVEISPGQPNQRINGSWVMVRITYRYPLYTPMIKTLLKNSDVMYDADHFDITRYAIYRVE